MTTAEKLQHLGFVVALIFALWGGWRQAQWNQKVAEEIERLKKERGAA